VSSPGASDVLCTASQGRSLTTRMTLTRRREGGSPAKETEEEEAAAVESIMVRILPELARGDGIQAIAARDELRDRLQQLEDDERDRREQREDDERDRALAKGILEMVALAQKIKAWRVRLAFFAWRLSMWPKN
jgi:hypothetical protein